MTAPLPSQHTAPVAEFRCLFTHDVRRKQKRWQDGFLKLHAFNSRVMVYDEYRNFLGDTYHKASTALLEGDMLNLEKGIIVEVAEPMGITQTDLTPLFESKAKEQPRNSSQMRHKSLNALLGTPKGPMGKAQPMRSPYEARKERENEELPAPVAKRQKTTHSPAALPAIASSLAAVSSPPRATNSRSTTLGHARSLLQPISNCIPRNERPSAQTTRIPRGKVPVPSVKAWETPKGPGPTSSPPVSASNRLANVESLFQPLRLSPKKPIPPPSPPRNPKAKSLRLSTGVKRGTLICEGIPSQNVIRHGMPSVMSLAQKVQQTSHNTSRESSPCVSHEGKSRPRQDTCEVWEELGPSKRITKSKPIPENHGQKQKHASPPPPTIPLDLYDDPELIHGKMDEPLLAISSSVSPLYSRKNRIAKLSEARNGSVKILRNSKPDEQEAGLPQEPHVDVSSTVIFPIEGPGQKLHPQKKAKEKRSPDSQVMAPSLPDFDMRISACGIVSPTTPNTSGICLQNSTSSHKPLSTGGFNKKPSHKVKQSATTIGLAPQLPKRHNEPVPLPAHLPQSVKHGPLMSTTELPAVSVKSSSLKRVADEACEEYENPVTGRSPTRIFKRVRSANYAPLPSAAKHWEEKNLPTASSILTHVSEPYNTTRPLTIPMQELVAKKKDNELSALTSKKDPRRKLIRAQSLAVDTNVALVVQADSPSPVIDHDVGPWSTEADYLFTWRRPPGNGRKK